MSVSTSSIPAEIIDHIFSFLQSDPTTLEICSRAHPILSPLAERFLYVDIILPLVSISDNVDDTKRPIFLPAELHRLLTESPHIANYVHKLQIHLPEIAQLPKGLSRNRFPPILAIMLQLRSISLTCDSGSVQFWGFLPSEFRDAFIDRLRSSFSVVEEVSICLCYYFPFDVFDSCQTVKILTVYGPGGQHFDLRITPTLQLSSLSLHQWGQTSPEFLAWMKKRIHSLRSLLFYSSEKAAIQKDLPDLVRACSNSLTSLDLDICMTFASRFHTTRGTLSAPGWRMGLDLSSVPHLKYLAIGASLRVESAEYYFCPFPAIIEVLQTVLHLNTLTLHFRLLGIYGNLIDWSPLLSLFSGSFAKFGHIELRFTFSITLSAADILKPLFNSEIVSDLILRRILDIRTVQE